MSAIIKIKTESGEVVTTFPIVTMQVDVSPKCDNVYTIIMNNDDIYKLYEGFYYKYISLLEEDITNKKLKIKELENNISIIESKKKSIKEIKTTLDSIYK